MAPLLKKFQGTLVDIIYDVAQLIPVAAFLFISSTPAESLAFVDVVEVPHTPLAFVRDPSLVDTAIDGNEAYPTRASRIPVATQHIAAGMAVRVLATAYSSSGDQTDANPFATASGTHVHQGTLAANFLPFGSQVRIGEKIYTVEDRLNSRYNGRYIVDLWFPSREEALRFGVQVVEMEIVSIPYIVLNILLSKFTQPLF
ncbi:MAG: 3D domain-containing protein, partial [Candidatus Andersenbacteria bacterium]